MLYFFFFNDTATTEIYTLSLHDALPILLIYALLLPGLYLTWRGSLIAGYWLLTVAVLSAVVTLAHFVGAQREAPIRDIYAVYESPVWGLLALVDLASIYASLAVLAGVAIRAYRRRG